MPAAARYALCQLEPSPPDPTILAAAFREAPGLTALDARLAARQGCGILADRLDRDVAVAMSTRLAADGYRSTAVPEIELELARAFLLRRADVLPRALVVYDVYGRPSEIAWSSLLVVHAGTYPEGALVTAKDAGWEIVGDMTIMWEAEHDYVETDATVLELVVAEPRRRYTIATAPFDYRYLGERKRTESSENFAILLDDVLRRVYASMPEPSFRPPGDALGLRNLRRYPSRRLFDRHLTWLVWCAANAS